MDITLGNANRPRKGTVQYRLGQLKSLRRQLACRCDGRVPPLRQLQEILYLRTHGGLGPLSYYRLGLFRASLPWSEKKNFVSEEWYRSRMERLNRFELRFAAWNKVIAHGLLARFGVRAAPFYGVAHAEHGQTFDGHPLRCAADLEALIRRAGLDRACFKLVAGSSGRGFLKVSFEEAEGRAAVCIQPSGPRLGVDDFWREYIEPGGGAAAAGHGSAFGYLCEGVVEQHAAVAALHADSVNTARVWMAQIRPGRWEMFGALLRMGVGSNAVDNSDRGGIGAPIDVATGRLGRAVRHGLDYYEGHNFESFDTHPTTGAPIEGVLLPMWDDMPAFCRRVCSVFPYFKLMGLDIAFAPDGPLVIEVEADPHSTHQTYMGRGLRPLLEELVNTWSP